jgi:hypothetical protein
MKEPGLRSTADFSVSLSQDVASAGDRLLLATEVRSQATVVRGKVLGVEELRDGGWRSVGVLVAGPDASHWVPGESARVTVTMEGYPLSVPMHIDVPPLAPGLYRLRLDVIAIEDSELRQRTATLYAPLTIE